MGGFSCRGTSKEKCPIQNLTPYHIVTDKISFSWCGYISILPFVNLTYLVHTSTWQRTITDRDPQQKFIDKIDSLSLGLVTDKHNLTKAEVHLVNKGHFDINANRKILLNL